MLGTAAADSGLRQRRIDALGRAPGNREPAVLESPARYPPLHGLDARALMHVYGTTSATWVGASGMLRSVLVLVALLAMMYFFSRKRYNDQVYY